MSQPIAEPAIIKKRSESSISLCRTADELANSRVLFLDNQVTQESVSILIKWLLYLENKDPETPITLMISSPGGDVYAGLALCDVMADLECSVKTVALGMVASIATVILACGDERAAYPHTHIMIHQLMGGMGMSQQSDIEIAAQHMADMRSLLEQILSEHGSRTAKEFHELSERDLWCTAQEALELGLIDTVF